MRDEAPVDQAEVEFVQKMAEALWLSNRSMRLLNQSMFVIESGTPDEQRKAKKDLALYMRYHSKLERTFTRFSTELRKRRNERGRAERGFVSQKYREAQERRREDNEKRKTELHELRKTNQICRHERQQIQNRISVAKAERLELQNRVKKAAASASADSAVLNEDDIAKQETFAAAA
jgi:Rps23 Pro-64 3,4-dihydroxylase Tpa1-like proline 4-hydroxylase